MVLQFPSQQRPEKAVRFDTHQRDAFHDFVNASCCTHHVGHAQGAFAAADLVASRPEELRQLLRFARSQLDPPAPRPDQRDLEGGQSLQFADAYSVVAEGRLPVERLEPVGAEQPGPLPALGAAASPQPGPRREDGCRHHAGRRTPKPATSRAGATSARKR